MKPDAWLGLAIAVGLPAAIVLEAWRQSRKYGRASGKGAALMRAGMIELQGKLEPEKKVEWVLCQEDADKSAVDPGEWSLRRDAACAEDNS
jgi:hypothetical protein